MLARCATVLALLAPIGCLGSFSLSTGADGGDGGNVVLGGDGGPLSLRQRYELDVAPILDGNCAACHSKDGGAGPSFLKPVSYDTLRGYPGMIVADAQASHLVTKGQHAGPAFTSSQAERVGAWLALEAQALPPPDLESAPATPPLRPVVGANSIDLGSLDAAFAAHRITFDAKFVGASLVLSNITVRTGASSGLHLVHPLFIVISGGVKNPDPVDSFSNLDQTVERGGAEALGPGTLILNNVGSLDQISIAFLKIETSGAITGGSDGGTAPDGGLGGGCKAVASFTGNARPTLSQRCVSCHGGNNGQATNALDMTRVNDTTSAGQAAACGQVKGQVNTTTPATSGAFVNVDPSKGSTHPFKFPDSTSFNAYVQMATQWVNAEK